MASFDPALNPENGVYLQDCHVDMKAVEPYAVDQVEAERLWSLSETFAGQEFEY